MNNSRTKRFIRLKLAPRRRAKIPSAARSRTPDAVPFRLKRILVTTDFSGESKKALPYAAMFSKRFDGGVALLNVLKPPPPLVGEA